MPKASSKKTDKIVDVAKPGSSAPDASARPVIVGHRTILQDPMVKPAEEKSEDAEQITVVSTTAPTLKPLDDADAATDKPKKAAKEKESAKAEKPSAKDDSTPEEGQAYVIEPVKPKAEEPKETEPEPEEKDEPDEAPKETAEDKAEPAAAEDKPEAGSDDQAATEAVAEQAAAKKTAEKEDKEAAARAEAVQKLVADKTYYVPIGQAKRRRRLSLAVLLIVLLLAALVYLAIDADIIKTSINLPVQFFH